jgi:hypothetical protein
MRRHAQTPKDGRKLRSGENPTFGFGMPAAGAEKIEYIFSNQ